jgi:regulator of RNase E activity RraB
MTLEEDWTTFTEETVAALINDGSNATMPHTIEHHIAAKQFDKLEKAAVEAFKLGFEVTDAEELVLDDGGTLFSFDAVIDKKLDAKDILADVEKLEQLASKFNVFYDGWGTYFIE